MTTDIYTSIFGYVFVFILGLLSGLILESWKFQFQKKKDNWNELKPELEKIYFTIRNLKLECTKAILNQNAFSPKEVREISVKINKSLEEFLIWFKPFERNLGIKKLDSIDEELSAGLTGLYHLAGLSIDNPKYIISRLSTFNDVTLTVECRLEQFMKAKIPHYVLTRKRRLENWRNSRF